MMKVLHSINVVNLNAMKKHQAIRRVPEPQERQVILTVCIAILAIGFIMYNVFNVIF
jgi:hypothetical protein